VVSHGLRLKHKDDPQAAVTLDSYTLDDLLGRNLPGAKEQADAFILWLGNRQSQNSPSEYVPVAIPEVGAIMGTTDVGPSSPTEGLDFILNSLAAAMIVERGVVPGTDPPIQRCRLSLATGWPRYEGLKKTQSATTTVQGVPASDRIVSLNHNAPEYKQSMKVLTQAIDAVRGNNEYGNADPEDKEQRLAELEAGGRLLKARRIGFRVLEWLVATLRIILSQIKDEVIKRGTTGLIDYLVSLMHR
jgi:hypothetical protein